MNTESLRFCGEGSVALGTLTSAQAAILRHFSCVDDDFLVCLGSLVAFYAKTERKLSKDEGGSHVHIHGGRQLPRDARFRVGQ